MARFIRRWHWLVYPLVGAGLGTFMTGDIETGAMGGGFLGLTCSFWYSMRQLRYSGRSYKKYGKKKWY